MKKKHGGKPVYEKSDIDPSKLNKKGGDEKEVKEPKSNEDLNTLLGFGNLTEDDRNIEMDDGSIKTMSPYLLKDYRKVLDLLQEMSDVKSLKPEQVLDTIVDLAFLSMKRKHPDITKDYLNENVDLSSSQKIMKVVLTYAGVDALAKQDKKKVE